MALTQSQTQDVAERICSILASHAAHGLATSSLEGMGEITLRDSLVVAAAAAGSEQKQAWVLTREVLPNGWTDSAVDLTVYRRGNSNALREVGAVELKWWRQDDKGNASNRRRDLVKDFIRAGALYQNMESFSFVALLSTEVSWEATTSTRKGDQPAMALVSGDDSQKWKIEELKDCPAVKGAVKSLNRRVPIPNIFHTKVLATLDLHLASGRTAFARVWAVNKPQRTKFLSNSEVKKLLK
ncbi:hypothetical protein [Algiphilus sp.]|uniref:hypothetical protein n=1 Tax=Algiphilus sp. TaxID=1872431 RepID=UPI003BAAA06A